MHEDALLDKKDVASVLHGCFFGEWEFRLVCSERFKEVRSLMFSISLSLSASLQPPTSVAFSPQANYTNWATAAGRRILMPTSCA
jgi:hypothetical protein